MREGLEMKKLGEVCDLSAGGDVPKNNFSEIETEEYKIPIYANGEKNNGLYGFTSIASVLMTSTTVPSFISTQMCQHVLPSTVHHP